MQGFLSGGWVPPGEGRQQVSTPKTVKIILKTSPPASKVFLATLLPPASTLGPAEVEKSTPCPAPPAPTQCPAPHASNLKTINITLNTSPPSSAIFPDTLLPPASASYGRGGVRPRSFLPPQLVQAEVEQSPQQFIWPCSFLPPQLVPAEAEQSPPCLAPSAPTQIPEPHASTLHTPNQ